MENPETSPNLVLPTSPAEVRTMRPRFAMNGDLWTDMLDHVAMVSYDYSRAYDKWVALTRSYRLDDKGRPFNIYEMDQIGEFRKMLKLPGREPLVLKQYKKRYLLEDQPKAPLLPAAPRAVPTVWRKGMTAGEWEGLNGVPSPERERTVEIEQFKDWLDG